MSQAVFSDNEYSVLQEVIVGRVENSIIPSFLSTKPYIYSLGLKRWFLLPACWLLQHRPYPDKLIQLAYKELEGLVEVLQAHDVNVKRPGKLPENLNKRKLKTKNGEACIALSACPRDLFFVLGQTMVICASPMRHRVKEWILYKELLEEYKKKGVRLIYAPEPNLTSISYHSGREIVASKSGPPSTYVITEEEPLFEAADFLRCGNVVLYQKSNVTNLKGADWLKQQFKGEKYKFAEVKTKCREPVHIDTTIASLGHKTLIMNPDYVDEKEIRKALTEIGEENWKIYTCPRPDKVKRKFTYLDTSSQWLSMNFLSISEESIIVEKEQVSLIKFLKSIGKKVIPISFNYLNQFGGGIHCVTTDILRKRTR